MVRESVGGEERDGSGVSRADILCRAADGRRTGDPDTKLEVQQSIRGMMCDDSPKSGVIETRASTLSSLSTSFSAAVRMRTIESAAESKSRYRSPTIVLRSATFASAASLDRHDISPPLRQAVREVDTPRTLLETSDIANSKEAKQLVRVLERHEIHLVRVRRLGCDALLDGLASGVAALEPGRSCVGNSRSGAGLGRREGEGLIARRGEGRGRDGGARGRELQRGRARTTRERGGKGGRRGGRERRR